MMDVMAFWNGIRIGMIHDGMVCLKKCKIML